MNLNKLRDLSASELLFVVNAGISNFTLVVTVFFILKNILFGFLVGAPLVVILYWLSPNERLFIPAHSGTVLVSFWLMGIVFGCALMMVLDSLFRGDMTSTALWIAAGSFSLSFNYWQHQKILGGSRLRAESRIS